jgi:hypothetical protein
MTYRKKLIEANGMEWRCGARRRQPAAGSRQVAADSL